MKKSHIKAGAAIIAKLKKTNKKGGHTVSAPLRRARLEANLEALRRGLKKG